MSIVSYAQNFEDVLLWRALHDVEQGRYLDIGAQDPVVDSVSLAFYQAGWRGVHVEPIPHYAARLREARPEECVIEAAVTDAAGPILLYELGGLSSGRLDVAEHHARSGHIARQMFVPTVRLDDLLKVINADIHWLKIDVEGMEADVLRSWGKSGIRPWVLVIEATFPNTQEPTHHLWLDEVLRRGYEQVFFDGLSRYFVHEAHAELESRFAAPANVFDQFAISRHHFSGAIVCADLEASEHRARDQAAEVERLNQELLSTTERLLSEQREQELALRHAHEKELIETRWRERQAAEAQLRDEARQTEGALRRAIEAAETASAESRTDLARLEERTFQLEHKLARADHASEHAEQRLAEALRQIGEAHQTAAAARASVAKADAERDQARAEQSAAQLQAQDAAERLRSELGHEIDRYRGALAEASRLISEAVAEPRNWWRRIGEALGLARPRPAWQALASWSLPAIGQPPMAPITNVPTTEGSETIMYRSTPTKAGNPYLRANSLPELLSWHDVDFVRCAYVTVLGRQPDPEGEAYYTDRIRQGRSKLELIWQLRKSPEGPRHDPGISGFDRALKRAAWARKPILGWPLRLLGRKSDDNDSLLQLRALRNDLSCLTALTQTAVQGILSRLDQLEFAGPDPNNFQGRKPPRSLRDPIEFKADLSADQKIDCLKQAVNSSQEAASLRS